MSDQSDYLGPTFREVEEWKALEAGLLLDKKNAETLCRHRWDHYIPALKAFFHEGWSVVDISFELESEEFTVQFILGELGYTTSYSPRAATPDEFFWYVRPLLSYLALHGFIRGERAGGRS